MEAPAKPESWHLEKRINVGHILTTFLLVAAMFSWTGRIESALLVQQARIDALENVQQLQIEVIQKDITKLSSSMDKLSDKLETWRKAN